MIKIDQEILETFVALAKYKNFSEVAYRRNIAQSTVSKQIKNLENELGTKLIIRKQKGSTLTASGELFLKYAEQIIELYQRSKSEIRRIDEPTLTFASVPLFGETILPEYINAFQGHYPDIQVELTLGSSKDIIQGLDEYKYDLIFLSDYAFCDDNYMSQIVMVDPIHLIAPFGLFKADLKEVNLSDIKSQTLIVKGNRSSFDDYISDELSQIDPNFSFLNVKQIGSQTNIVKTVAYGSGVAFVSSMLNNLVEEEGNLVHLPLADKKLERNVLIVYEKDLRNEFSLLDKFINFMEDKPIISAWEN